MRWCWVRLCVLFSILISIVSAKTKEFGFKTFVEDDEYDDTEYFDPDEFVMNAKQAAERHNTDTPKSSRSHPQDQNYWAETAALLFIIVYAINFLIGKRQNEQIAQDWYDAMISTFETQFAHVGAFEGESKPIELYKDSQSCFKFYASGRRYCAGLLATLELKKRHDLFSLLLALVDLSTARDSVTIEIPMDDMEPFVFLVGHKRDAAKWRKTFHDVNQFARITLRSSKQFTVLTDCTEIESEFMNNLVTRTLKENKNLFVMLHLTDQNSNSFVSARKLLRFQFYFPDDGNFSQLTKLVQMSIYFIDKAARIKLSPQARAKAEKSRQRVDQERMRANHPERQEAYAKWKSDQKRKQEENAPELTKEQQRKKEAREHKQALKKRTPKLKIMK